MEREKRDGIILAMYDIRGKQDFIYKSSRIKEIVGASYIIRDCFRDYLYPAAKDYKGKGIYSYTEEVREDFSPEGFLRHLREGYIGEVIYDGGGNFFVLYESMDTYREVNRRFYRRLLEGTYSLRVLTTWIDEVHFDDYRKDQRELYRRHRLRDQAETMLHPVNTLPVVQTDYRTSLPLAELQWIGNRMEKVSYESKRKYAKYEEIEKHPRRIVRFREAGFWINGDGKGEESLLAVVYIDGNNMGAQVERCLQGKSYAECIRALRKFSAEIQENYITERIRDGIGCWMGKVGKQAVCGICRRRGDLYLQCPGRLSGREGISGKACRKFPQGVSENILRRNRSISQPCAVCGGIPNRGGVLRGWKAADETGADPLRQPD